MFYYYVPNYFNSVHLPGIAAFVFILQGPDLSFRQGHRVPVRIRTIKRKLSAAIAEPVFQILRLTLALQQVQLQEQVLRRQLTAQ